MAKSRTSEGHTPSWDEKTFLTSYHPLLLALSRNRYKDLSDEATCFAVADEFGLEYTGQGGADEILSLEVGLFNYFSQSDKLFKATETVWEGIASGNIEVVRFQLYIQSLEELGTNEEIMLRDELQLYVNGKIVIQPVAGTDQAMILEALDNCFLNARMEDYEKMMPMQRIKHVLRCYWKLVEYPGDKFSEVLEVATAKIDRTFKDPTRTPEHIGKAYVHYLKTCIEEEREDRYIRTFSSFIKKGTWMKDDPNACMKINLYDQPEHRLAIDVFKTAMPDATEPVQDNNPDQGDDLEEGGVLVS